MSSDETPNADPPRESGEPLLASHEGAAGGDDAHGLSAVVGIGASAGGLGALKAVLGDVPPGTGIAFVVVVHLSPEHESRLAELLQPHARLPVLQVTETIPIRPDHVYVIPPNANLSAIDTHLRLTELEHERRERWPIDHFFRTLAATHHERAIGVVLTGSGSDGALGLRKIHERGGLTIVQDPEDAEYDGMPQSAIATGLVDLVVPLRQIAGCVLEHAQLRPQVPVPSEGGRVPPNVEQVLHKVLAQVRGRTGRDFTRYKRSTIMRRIERRMQLQKVMELQPYVDMLRDDPDEARRLADELLVTVTEFFRDDHVFQTLESSVVPALFDRSGREGAIRAWSVGCATGEEAYSLAMLLLEEAERRNVSKQIQVFASDLHEPSLAKAREGTYPDTIEARVSPERIRRFFVPESGGYRVCEELRETVVFTPHNLLADAPFSRLDLISCRNVLIYLQRDVQRNVAKLFHYALRPEGFLVVGTAESLERTDLFRRFGKGASILQKRDVPSGEPRLPVFPMNVGHAPSAESAEAEKKEGVAYGGLHQEMVELYAPPSVLLDPDNNIVHVSENAGRYLQVQGGQPTSNVFKLIRDELRIELRTALHMARESGEPARSKPVPVPRRGVENSVTLDVRPAAQRQHEGFKLVIFDERPDDEGEGVAQGPRDDAHAQEIEAELELTRQRLRAVIEEYETSQEEMRASNEELQSMNEELRSTLEELETSKEELQSVNEELTALNQENRHKVEELQQLAGDLQNLLDATAIATLFLDRDLRIMRFTPQIGDLFNIRVSDRGRPLAHFSHQLGYDDLVDDARRVLEDLVPVEREIVSEEGSHYLTRILPYRSQDDRIDGVVITFVDVTEAKEAAAERANSERILQAVIDQMPLGVSIAEAPSGRLLYYNDEAVRITGRAVTDPGRHDDGTGAVHVDGTPYTAGEYPLARALEGEVVQQEEMLYRCVDGERRTLSVNASPVRDGQGGIVRAVSTFEDVTQRKRAEEDLRRLNETLEEKVEERTRQVRRLAANLSLAEQHERARIAQVLHDDIQQLLHSLHVKYALIGRANEERDVEALLEEAQDILKQAIRATRTLTVEINPPVLREEGIAEAFRWLASYMRERYDLEIELSFDFEDPLPLDESQRVIIFHSARELLFNVVKHVGTRRGATLGLSVDDGDVVVEVVDRGAGFDVDEALDQRPLGFGLANIRERLRLAGGSLEIRSRPGQGTRAVIRLPVG